MVLISMGSFLTLAWELQYWFNIFMFENLPFSGALIELQEINITGIDSSQVTERKIFYVYHP